MSKLLIPIIHSIPEGVALIDTVLRHYIISNICSCKLYNLTFNDTYSYTAGMAHPIDT